MKRQNKNWNLYQCHWRHIFIYYLVINLHFPGLLQLLFCDTLFKQLIHEASKATEKKEGIFWLSGSSKVKVKTRQSFQDSLISQRWFSQLQSLAWRRCMAWEGESIRGWLVPWKPFHLYSWPETQDLEEAGNLRHSRAWGHPSWGGLGKAAWESSVAQARSKRQLGAGSRQAPQGPASTSMRRRDQFPEPLRVLQMWHRKLPPPGGWWSVCSEYSGEMCGQITRI